VFPGSTVHLECLFSRRLGSPDWTWTSPLGQYLTGWAIASEERDWKYRLSIYYVKPQDSGTFTCATPRGITNSLTLQVSAVHCDPISVSGPHLTVRVEGTRLGHTAIFQCPMGFKVNGAANLTCQASGKWSAPVPRCELVKCESLSTPGGLYEPHLQLEEHNNSYGGRAVFSCAWGYRLMGPPGIECELNGNWSGPLPKCVRKYIVVTNLSSFMTRTFFGHRQPSSVRHPLFQLTAISYSRRRREWTAADTPSAAWYNSRAGEPISSKARPASSARRTDSGPIRRLFVNPVALTWASPTTAS
jgi:hypothetical protein